MLIVAVHGGICSRHEGDTGCGFKSDWPMDLALGLAGTWTWLTTFRATADALRAAGVAVLHDHAIPFPIGNWQARFVAEVRQALVKIDGGWTPAWRPRGD